MIYFKRQSNWLLCILHIFFIFLRQDICKIISLWHKHRKDDLEERPEARGSVSNTSTHLLQNVGKSSNISLPFFCICTRLFILLKAEFSE